MMMIMKGYTVSECVVSNMPPIRLREGQAFPKADGRYIILFKVRVTGLAVYNCIFHAFLQGSGRITHAFPHLVGRHLFSILLDAARPGSSAIQLGC